MGVKTAVKAAGGFFSYYKGITVLFMPACNGKGTMSWAICSPNNNKFSKKDGRSFAYERWKSGISLPIPKMAKNFGKETDTVWGNNYLAKELASLFSQL